MALREHRLCHHNDLAVVVDERQARPHPCRTHRCPQAVLLLSVDRD